MMLLGSVLTLLVVVGLFASYLIYVAPGHQKLSTQQVKQTVAATAKAQNTPQSSKPLSLPPAKISAGQQLYGTNLPGPSCDTQGGKWRTGGGVNVTCKGGTTILTTNTGSSSAGIYLDKLPNQSLPSSYIIQLQVDANASHGTFDIYFFNQSGSQGWDRCQIDPGASWQFSEYRNGATSNFYTGHLQKAPLHGTVTFNIKIQGSSYNLYTNGTEEGGAISGTYTNGGMGLGVESGAQVSVKNLAIYALS
jgi:hypothetical protein